jgi:quinolinate synthase
MGMNGLDNLLSCIGNGTNEIFVDSKIAQQAIQSLDRMMNFKALHLS